jgi:hypothetical protein
MDCPACHAENPSAAVACVTCGHSLRDLSAGGNVDRSARRSGSRRRNLDASEAAVTDTKNPHAWRAYRVSLWSIVPGFGLLLGFVAILLGWHALRGTGDDLSASNRARAAIVIGAGSMITQWLGVTLIYLN